MKNAISSTVERFSGNMQNVSAFNSSTVSLFKKKNLNHFMVTGAYLSWRWANAEYTSEWVAFTGPYVSIWVFGILLKVSWHLPLLPPTYYQHLPCVV